MAIMTKMTKRKVLTAAQAKTNLSSSLREVEGGGVVVITRYGVPVAALVNVQDLEELERLRARTRVKGLAGLAGKWSDGNELVEQLDQIQHDASREFPGFD